MLHALSSPGLQESVPWRADPHHRVRPQVVNPCRGRMSPLPSALCPGRRIPRNHRPGHAKGSNSQHQPQLEGFSPGSIHGILDQGSSVILTLRLRHALQLLRSHLTDDGLPLPTRRSHLQSVLTAVAISNSDSSAWLPLLRPTLAPGTTFAVQGTFARHEQVNLAAGGWNRNDCALHCRSSLPVQEDRTHRAHTTR